MKIKPSMFAVSMVLSAISLNAQALTTAYNVNGVDLVYSSISDVTWTKDANLLGSMMSSQGYSNVVNAIIAANPGYTFTTSTFLNNPSEYGQASWVGSMAFANYLNSINYAGSNQWRLPSAGDSPAYGYDSTDSEFGQLFYGELGGTPDNSIPDTSLFINEKIPTYWLSTEWNTSGAWVFNTIDGIKEVQNKLNRQFVWAVSPGQVAAVPVPAAAWLFGPALASLGACKRRRKLIKR